MKNLTNFIKRHKSLALRGVLAFMLGLVLYWVAKVTGTLEPIISFTDRISYSLFVDGLLRTRFVPAYFGGAILFTLSAYFYIDYVSHRRPLKESGVKIRYTPIHHARKVTFPVMWYERKTIIKSILYPVVGILMFVVSLIMMTILFGGSARAYDANEFVTVWKTDNPGTSNSQQITIPLQEFTVHDITINWGDATTSTNVTGTITHTYASPGTYTVRMSGTIGGIYFDNYGDRQKILSVEQWGNQQWASMQNAFYGATNLVLNATDEPDLSNVTDMSNMFRDAASMNQSIDGWDVSNVQEMDFMFGGASAFNQPLQSWQMGQVTSAHSMFYGAASFNQPLNGWDITGIQDMTFFFHGALAFNQPLNSWDVSNVTNMFGMFGDTNAFNQPLDGWNVSNVATDPLFPGSTGFSGMFAFATAFDQPLNSWDVSGGTDFISMFDHATSFNRPLNNWDTSNATDMSSMFKFATAFNQSLEGWDTSNVTNMSAMFENASAYNQPMSTWDVSSVMNMSRMFISSSFNRSLATWDVSNVTNMSFFVGNSMSSQNYEAALMSWKFLSVRTNVQLGAGTITFCSAAAARYELTNTHGWIITDGGLSCPPVSVGSSVADGEYSTGSVIPIQVIYAENVFVTGFPKIYLDTGNVIGEATYTSGSGTNVLTFTYTVSPDQFSEDLSYRSSNPLTLEGGSIKYAGNHDATLELPPSGQSGNLANDRDIIIDSRLQTDFSLNVNLETAKPIRQGQNVVYRFTVKNNGPNIAQFLGGVVIVLPTELTYDAQTYDDLECIPQGTTDTYGAPAFAELYPGRSIVLCYTTNSSRLVGPGDTTTFTIKGTANTDFTNGVLVKALYGDPSFERAETISLLSTLGNSAAFLASQSNNIAAYVYSLPIAPTLTPSPAPTQKPSETPRATPQTTVPPIFNIDPKQRNKSNPSASTSSPSGLGQEQKSVGSIVFGPAIAKFIEQQPWAVPVLFFIILLILALILAIQAGLEHRNLIRLRKSLVRLDELQGSVITFMRLVQHHLRTPVSTMQLALELAASQEDEVAVNAQQSIRMLGADIESILDEATSALKLPMNVSERLATARLSIKPGFTSRIFLVPTIGVTALVIIYNVLVLNIFDISVTAQLTLLQIAVAIGSIFVYAMSTGYARRIKLRKGILEDITQEHIALQTTRHMVVEKITTTLQKDYDRIGVQIKNLADTHETQIVRDGYTQIGKLMQRLNIIEQLQSIDVLTLVGHATFNIHTQIDEIVRRVGAGDPEQVFKVMTEKLSEPVVHGPVGLIDFALISVIQNASQHALGESPVSIFVETKKASTIVRITNYVDGITDGQIPKMFEPFSRVGGTLQFDDAGAGISLYVSRAIMRRFGGDITLKMKGTQSIECMVIIPIQLDSF